MLRKTLYTAPNALSTLISSSYSHKMEKYSSHTNFIAVEILNVCKVFYNPLQRILELLSPTVCLTSTASIAT